jgi:hypothetical protein
MRRRTGLSHEQWAERIDYEYCRRVPAEQRNLPAPDLCQYQNDAETHSKLRRAWDQTLRRWCSGERHFPMELMWSWIDALDEPWRSDCGREVARSLGFVGAKVSEPSGRGDTMAWGSMMVDFGNLTQDVSHVLADGQIHDGDREHLPDIIKHCQAVRADAATLEERARAVLNGVDLRSVS